MYWISYSNHKWPGFLIYMKTKYVRPSVVPHNIKVELSSEIPANVFHITKLRHYTTHKFYGIDSYSNFSTVHVSASILLV